MVRKLPEDLAKRRLQYFKRIYQHREHWQALMEDRGMPDIMTTPEGEDIFLGDLMTGIDTLPRRQREAFELICLQGYTETDARDEMLPNSKSSTPVQQYADSGLIRMVAAYDLKQAGQWPPEPKPITPPLTRRQKFMAALHPIVKAGLEATRKKLQAELESIQSALAYVDEQLSGAAPSGGTPVAPPPSAAQQPAPNPKPANGEGKPKLEDMAKQLAGTA